MSTVKRPLETAASDTVARSVVTALASAEEGEVTLLRWVLGPVRRPRAPVPRRGGRSAATYLGGRDDLLRGAGLGVEAQARRGPVVDAEVRTALAYKEGVSGWRAALHLGVKATGRRRQRLLLGRLAGAVRVANRSGAQVGFRPARRSVLWSGRLPLWRPLLVNVEEMTGLAGWPIGKTDRLPVQRQRSTSLPPAAAVPSGQRVVALATYSGRERPCALSVDDARQHLHVIGPTGVGKTVLLLNLIVRDMVAGRSVVVIEPTGDLVRDVLERVPDDRLDDVVVIDPTDSEAIVGVNPLAAGDVPADLRADHVLTVMKRLWADSWGPRTQDILTAGLLTLARTPGTSLVTLPLLFSDEALRREVTSHVHDPIALGPFWEWFEGCSPAERSAALAPVMNKLRAFLFRERLRRVIGQAEPRFDLREIYWGRRIVLVNVAARTLGPESSALLGSLIVSQLWQTILGRAAVPPAQRHPIMVTIDEFQTYLALPTDLADVLAQARGLGAGLTLAHQHLAQLQPAVHAAVLANCRSRVVFVTQHEDARVLVRGDERLTPADVTSLDRYAAYVSLLADGETTPWASARTLPPPPALRPPTDAYQRSRQRWARPVAEIDADLQRLVTRQPKDSAFKRTSRRTGRPKGRQT